MAGEQHAVCESAFTQLETVYQKTYVVLCIFCKKCYNTTFNEWSLPIVEMECKDKINRKYSRCYFPKYMGFLPKQLNTTLEDSCFWLLYNTGSCTE